MDLKPPETTTTILGYMATLNSHRFNRIVPPLARSLANQTVVSLVAVDLAAGAATVVVVVAVEDCSPKRAGDWSRVFKVAHGAEEEDPWTGIRHQFLQLRSIEGLQSFVSFAVGVSSVRQW